jgi:hypothetical protein
MSIVEHMVHVQMVLVFVRIIIMGKIVKMHRWPVKTADHGIQQHINVIAPRVIRAIRVWKKKAERVHLI